MVLIKLMRQLCSMLAAHALSAGCVHAAYIGETPQQLLAKQKNRVKVTTAIAAHRAEKLSARALSENLVQIAELTRLINLSPGESDCYLERAGHFAAIGEFDKARNDLTIEDRLLYYQYTHKSRISCCEPVTIRFSDNPLPADFRETCCIFENGPNGETSRAYKEYVQREKDRIEKIISTPLSTGIAVHYMGGREIPEMPGYRLWTFRISGTQTNKALTRLNLRFDTDIESFKLALSRDCKLDGPEASVSKRFDNDMLADLPNSSSLVRSVKITSSGIVFDADVDRDKPDTLISFVTGRAQSLGVYQAEMLIPGYQSVFASWPVPDNE